MNISAKNHVVFKSFGLILLISLLLGLLFSTIFYFFTLQNAILTVFANISLGIAVFSGAYYLTTNTYRFPLKSLLSLILLVTVVLFLMSLIIGDFNLTTMVKKATLSGIAAICGAIFGRI